MLKTENEMKLERTKNATRNIVFGIALKLYQILIPFVMRTVMIYFLGKRYLGLNSLFTSILQVLNLAELGVGSAMVYSMYKPIAEDDYDTICALMKLYRRYYRLIGLVVGAAGLILLPFLPYLVKTDTVPEGVSLQVLYLLNLGATVLSYWLFAYKNSLLSAHQRTDIKSKITISTDTALYLLQFLVLVFLRNYYIYLIVRLVVQVVTNLVTAYIVDRNYPDLKPKGNLDKEFVDKINHRVRDLFTSKLGGVVLNSADTVVISAFLGLEILAIYQNYFFIMSSITGMIAVVFTACTAGIGNSLIVETKEKNFNDFRTFNFIIVWIAGFCGCCMLCLFQPFMSIWVGAENRLAMSAVVCFCIYFFIYEVNMQFNNYKDAAGIWHEDRWRPLVTALTNLAMNLIFVQFWGIYGVLLSTVIATVFIGMPWLLHNLFTVIFPTTYLKPFLKKMAVYVLVVAGSWILTYRVCMLVELSDFLNLMIRGLICCIIPNGIYFVFARRTVEFYRSVCLADKMTKGKLKLERRLFKNGCQK